MAPTRSLTRSLWAVKSLSSTARGSVLVPVALDLERPALEVEHDAGLAPGGERLAAGEAQSGRDLARRALHSPVDTRHRTSAPPWRRRSP
jgi:hypothetical protein